MTGRPALFEEDKEIWKHDRRDAVRASRSGSPVATMLEVCDHSSREDAVDLGCGSAIRVSFVPRAATSGGHTHENGRRATTLSDGDWHRVHGLG